MNSKTKNNFVPNLETLKKEVKSHPPKYTYEALFELLVNLNKEMQNCTTLAQAILDDKMLEVEKDFPHMVAFLKKDHLDQKIRRIAKENSKDLYGACSVLVRIFIPTIVGYIFSIGKVTDENNTTRPILSIFMLYASCYQKFDDPNFIFAKDPSEKFVLLNEYVKNGSPYLKKESFGNILIHLSNEDFSDILHVFYGVLNNLKQEVLELKNHHKNQKDVYPKIEFIDTALSFFSPSFLLEINSNSKKVH